MIGSTPRGHYVDRDRLLYAGDEDIDSCEKCEKHRCRCAKCQICGTDYDLKTDDMCCNCAEIYYPEQEGNQ